MENVDFDRLTLLINQTKTNSFKSKRDALIFKLVYYCGLRPKDIPMLRSENFRKYFFISSTKNFPLSLLNAVTTNNRKYAIPRNTHAQFQEYKTHWEKIRRSPNSFLFPPYANASQIEWTFPLTHRGADYILRANSLCSSTDIQTIEALRILGLRRMAAKSICVYEIASRTGYKSGKALSRLFLKWGVPHLKSQNGPANERREKSMEKRWYVNRSKL